MKPVIDLSIEAEGWSRLPDAGTTIDGAVATAADHAGAALLAGAEVSILLCDDVRIRDLNREWRGFDKPTNVLSFPAASPQPIARRPFLGDIAIALETAALEAETEGKSLRAHVTHLVVHGFLHLIGYDHESDGDADAMERLEIGILAHLGIADPYADLPTAAITAL